MERYLDAPFKPSWRDGRGRYIILMLSFRKFTPTGDPLMKIEPNMPLDKTSTDRTIFLENAFMENRRTYRVFRYHKFNRDFRQNYASVEMLQRIFSSELSSSNRMVESVGVNFHTGSHAAFNVNPIFLENYSSVEILSKYIFAPVLIVKSISTNFQTPVYPSDISTLIYAGRSFLLCSPHISLCVTPHVFFTESVFQTVTEK